MATLAEQYSAEVLRLQIARNGLRSKAVELGIADTTADLDALADAYETIVNKGAVSAQVKEGETYTIPAGYHNGSGTVSGVAGGGNYTLQSKTATPTKAQQNITPDNGYYGLSDVTIAAIPAAYQDVTPTTATAADVLSPKIFVDKSGKSVAGTIPSNGDVSTTIDLLTQSSVSIAAGYTTGGTVTPTDDLLNALKAI